MRKRAATALLLMLASCQPAPRIENVAANDMAIDEVTEVQDETVTIDENGNATVDPD